MRKKSVTKQMKKLKKRKTSGHYALLPFGSTRQTPLQTWTKYCRQIHKLK